MDPSALSDAELEARLRQRAYDAFGSELVVDQLSDGSWRARCMTYNALGTANRCSSEDAETRRASLEGLWEVLELRDHLGFR